MVQSKREDWWFWKFSIFFKIRENVSLILNPLESELLPVFWKLLGLLEIPSLKLLHDVTMSRYFRVVTKFSKNSGSIVLKE